MKEGGDEITSEISRKDKQDLDFCAFLTLLISTSVCVWGEQNRKPLVGRGSTSSREQVSKY